MGFFKKMRAAIDAGMEGMTAAPAPLTDEQLGALTPQQRERYEANMAQVASGQQQVRGDYLLRKADHDAAVAARPLRGPAGEFVFGPEAFGEADPAALLQMSAAEALEWSLQQSAGQFKDLAANPMGRPTSPPVRPDGITGANSDAPRLVEAADRAQRDAARAPFILAPPIPVQITRIPTNGKDQVRDVARWLADAGLAARPDLVFGVYRVPDRIDPGRGGKERGHPVEWEVLHTATEPLPAGPEPAVAQFDATERRVDRGVGEPSVLDEDVGLALLAAAGVGPERCLGVSRLADISLFSSGDDAGGAYLWAQVVGLAVFAADPSLASAADRLRSERPVAVPAEPGEGTHLEILNWGAVRRAVQPDPHEPSLMPSPFAYLPSSPQELIQAYLAVVGVLPVDTYGVQVTFDRPADLIRARSVAGGFATVRGGKGGTPQPAADGSLRSRVTAGEQIVIAYRDKPAYVAGRDRWVSFMAQAYQGDLRQGIEARRAVQEPERKSGALDRFAQLADLVDGASGTGPPRTAPHRYCWPPRN